MSYQNIIVTGANRGLGFEFIKQLLASNPTHKNVIATTRSPSDQLNQLVSANPNLHVIIFDVIDYSSHQNFVEQVHKIVGDQGVDLLINNAGI